MAIELVFIPFMLAGPYFGSRHDNVHDYPIIWLFHALKNYIYMIHLIYPCEISKFRAWARRCGWDVLVLSPFSMAICRHDDPFGQWRTPSSNIKVFGLLKVWFVKVNVEAVLWCTCIGHCSSKQHPGMFGPCLLLQQGECFYLLEALHIASFAFTKVTFWVTPLFIVHLCLLIMWIPRKATDNKADSPHSSKQQLEYITCCQLCKILLLWCIDGGVVHAGWPCVLTGHAQEGESRQQGCNHRQQGRFSTFFKTAVRIHHMLSIV